MKRRIAALLSLMLVLCTCMNAMAASYSLRWTQAADGNWQVSKNGVLLKNTWVLDDQCDVADGLYYLLDENGNLVTNQIIRDGEGRYYTFNDVHDGHFGAMRTVNGTYNGVSLVFSAVHDGSFGSITNADGIAALTAKYGVREMPDIKNATMVKMSEITTSSSGGSISGDTRGWLYFDLDNVAVTTPSDYEKQQVKLNKKIVKPATPSSVSGVYSFKGWYKDADHTIKWDFEKDYIKQTKTTLYAGWDKNPTVPEMYRLPYEVRQNATSFTLGSYNEFQGEIETNAVVSLNEYDSVMLYKGKTEGTYYILAELDNPVELPADCSYMFAYAVSATTINFAEVDTSRITNLSSMFKGCEALTTLDVSSFDTANVTDMNAMFDGCKSLVTLTLAGGKFDTSNVTNMTAMFNSCEALTELDVSEFNTAKVRAMDYMFNACKTVTTVDVSGFDTANVVGMYYMFGHCDNLTILDLSSFHTSQVESMRRMFFCDANLVTIYASEDFVATQLDVTTSGQDMFVYCMALTGDKGTTCSGWHSDRAHLDGGAANPGYFSAKVQ